MARACVGLSETECLSVAFEVSGDFVSQTQFRGPPTHISRKFCKKSLPKRLKCALGREMKVEAKTGSDTMQLQICSPDRLFRIPLDVLVSWSINARGATLGAIGVQYISTKGLPGPDFAVFRFYSKAEAFAKLRAASP